MASRCGKMSLHMRPYADRAPTVLELCAETRATTINRVHQPLTTCNPPQPRVSTCVNRVLSNCVSSEHCVPTVHTMCVDRVTILSRSSSRWVGTWRNQATNFHFQADRQRNRTLITRCRHIILPVMGVRLSTECKNHGLFIFHLYGCSSWNLWVATIIIRHFAKH